jgi:hypothetical protein
MIALRILVVMTDCLYPRVLGYSSSFCALLPGVSLVGSAQTAGVWTLKRYVHFSLRAIYTSVLLSDDKNIRNLRLGHGKDGIGRPAHEVNQGRTVGTIPASLAFIVDLLRVRLW